ncbi:hypothetical protein Q9L58_005548 [Maublancomyces gigas]|uniref:Uncharacterized protein n=1 Tax=Discina gigas TaxID=1032678 RepID=A0ABR3GI61_9PEZI
MEAPSPPPEHQYFSQHTHDHWDLIEYLDWCKKQQLRDYGYEVTSSRWVKSLELIANNLEESQERRAKAQSLRDKYNLRCEKDRARQWFDPNKNRKGSNVTIYQGPVINAGRDVNVNELQTGTRKRLLEDESSDDEEIEGESARAVDNKRSKSSNPPSREKAEKVTKGPSLKRAFKLFVLNYESMEKKTRFSSSENILEDRIYQKVTTLFSVKSSWLTRDSSILLWIIDLQDPVVTTWFLCDELEELRSWTMPLPEPDKFFAHSVNRFFQAKTTEDYQNILETVPYRLADEAYDRQKYFDAGWVNFVVQAMLALFGSYGNLLTCATFREGWFDSNIWSPLIDHCLLGLDGIVVQRKEIKCYALKLIGNHGPRYDAIIHTPRELDPIEYAAIEVSRSAESDESLPSKKYLTDSIKLVTGLHSMLRRLHILVDRDADTIAELQVVGILNAGLNMQIIRMNSPNSNVFLLTRGSVRSIPTTIETLGTIFPLMNSIGMFKAIIRDSMAVVAGFQARKVSLQEGSDLYKQVMEQTEI